MTRDFIHPLLGEEVRAVGGGYTFLKEVVMPTGGPPVLYLVGVGVLDTSCCGEGGCGYALVPGFVVDLKGRETPDGEPVSRVEPIDDPALRRRFTEQIKREEGVQDVRFWSTEEEAP